MKKLLLAGIAMIGVATATSATAADLPARPIYKAPPPVVAPMTWDGWYGGLVAGYAWSNRGATETDSDFDCISGCPGSISNRPRAVWDALPGDQKFNAKGHMLGVTLGANAQWGSWVGGIEGDLSYTKIEGSASFTDLYQNGIQYPQTTVSSTGMDWFATLRARFGWLVTPNALLYVTGGGAAADVHASLNVNGTYSLFISGNNVPFAWQSNATARTTKYGWVVGGGGEYKVSANWSVKAEYLYYDLGSIDVTNDMSTAVSAAATSSPNILLFKTNSYKLTGDILRVGANMKF